MDLKALEQNFKELNAQMEAARKEMQAKSTGFIEAAVQNFLDECPEVESVSWTQYTPYFNDGDACEFSVNEVHYVLDGDEDPCDYEGSVIYTQKNLDYAQEKLKIAEEYTKDPYTWAENYKKEYRSKWGRDPYSEPKPYPWNPADAQERIDEIEEFLAKYPSGTIERIEEKFNSLKDSIGLIDEDIMQSIYGDHVKVTINRSGTDIDEYDHD